VRRPQRNLLRRDQAEPCPCSDHLR
jgi:hypothetical protein